MQKIKSILFKQPLLSLAALCFAIAIASPFVFVDSQVSKTQTTTAKSVSSKEKATITPSEGGEDTQAVQGQTSYTQTTSPTVSTQQITSAAQPTSQPTATNTPQPTSAPATQTFQVTLSINGSSVGSVTLDQGANQCDVLTKAKDQGKISQLLMRYVDSLGTNGVYQINGIGKDNAVWWVYKVNGTSPNQGCSYIKANSGDNVEWNYQGN